MHACIPFLHLLRRSLLRYFVEFYFLSHRPIVYLYRSMVVWTVIVITYILSLSSLLGELLRWLLSMAWHSMAPHGTAAA
jgi:hypothetical protein